MYTISIKTKLNIPAIKFLKIWRRPGLLLRTAPSIKKLQVLQRLENRLLTSWAVEIDKVILCWIQWDRIEPEKGIIYFKQVEGEFKSYQGTWQVTPGQGKTSVLSVFVCIDFGIPRFELHAHKKLERKTTLIFKQFIKSIKKSVETYGK